MSGRRETKSYSRLSLACLPELSFRIRFSGYVDEVVTCARWGFLQKFAHQLPRRPFVAPRLNQGVEHLTVLVDRPPQTHPTPANRDIHLIPDMTP